MKLGVLICTAMVIYLSVGLAQNLITEPRKPNCDDSGDVCPANYEPVCGDDGHTYSNECMVCLENKMKKQDVHITHTGECECQPKQQTTGKQY